MALDLDGRADPGLWRHEGRLGLDLEPPAPPEAARSIPLPKQVTAIDHRLGFDRLGAARLADIELGAALVEARKRPGNPGVADRVMTLFGAWAATRHLLGQDRKAQRAIQQIQRWAGGDHTSSLYAYTVERAVQIGAELTAVPRLEHALAVHLTTAGSGPAVIRCLIQLADALAREEVESVAQKRERLQTRLALCTTIPGSAAALSHLMVQLADVWAQEQVDIMSRQPENRRVRAALEAADGLLPDEPSSTRFEIRLRLARLHLKARNYAASIQKLSSLSQQGLSLVKQRRLLALHAELSEAQGSLPNAVRFRVAAVELAAEVCGPEIVLEDLLDIARLRRQLSTAFDSDDEGRLIQAAQGLRELSESPGWARSVRRLGRAVISGGEVDGAEPETLRAEILTLQQEALNSDLEKPIDALAV